MAAQNKQNNRSRKNKSMITKTSQTGSPASRERTAMKPTPVAMASGSLPNPSKPQRAVPSQAVIAKRAYEIWLSLGQVLGRDQETWFEAERQLRQV
jgi:hypothetical protein